MLNLDYECMKYAQGIVHSIDKSEKKNVKELENKLRKVQGVLQEDGIYAMFLWLESKEGKNIRKILIELLNESDIREHLLTNSSNFPDGFSEFCEILLREVAQDIDKLLFMKKLLERTLTYALYHAKIGG